MIHKSVPPPDFSKLSNTNGVSSETIPGAANVDGTPILATTQPTAKPAESSRFDLKQYGQSLTSVVAYMRNDPTKAEYAEIRDAKNVAIYGPGKEPPTSEKADSGLQAQTLKAAKERATFEFQQKYGENYNLPELQCATAKVGNRDVLLVTASGNSKMAQVDENKNIFQRGLDKLVGGVAHAARTAGGQPSVTLAYDIDKGIPLGLKPGGEEWGAAPLSYKDPISASPAPAAEKVIAEPEVHKNFGPAGNPKLRKEVDQSQAKQPLTAAAPNPSIQAEAPAPAVAAKTEKKADHPLAAKLRKSGHNDGDIDRLNNAWHGGEKTIPADQREFAAKLTKGLGDQEKAIVYSNITRFSADRNKGEFLAEVFEGIHRDLTAWNKEPSDTLSKNVMTFVPSAAQVEQLRAADQAAATQTASVPGDVEKQINDLRQQRSALGLGENYYSAYASSGKFEPIPTDIPKLRALGIVDSGTLVKFGEGLLETKAQIDKEIRRLQSPAAPITETTVPRATDIAALNKIALIAGTTKDVRETADKEVIARLKVPDGANLRDWLETERKKGS